MGSTKWNTHYEALPHDNCQDPKHCDCDCDACLKARKGRVVNSQHRAWYIREFGNICREKYDPGMEKL